MFYFDPRFLRASLATMAGGSEVEGKRRARGSEVEGKRWARGSEVEGKRRARGV